MRSSNQQRKLIYGLLIKTIRTAYPMTNSIQDPTRRWRFLPLIIPTLGHGLGMSRLPSCLLIPD